MSRKGEKTRARLVEATAALLQKQGYHATGLAEILRASEAPKGSLYFHFPGGKEELACTALAEAGRAWRARIEPIVASAPTLAAAIDGTIEALTEDFLSSDFLHGCPVATVALEASATSEDVRLTSAAQYRSWEELIAGRLRDAGVADEPAAELAQVALAMIEGGLLLARVYRDPAPLRRAGAALHALLEGTGID